PQAPRRFAFSYRRIGSEPVRRPALTVRKPEPAVIRRFSHGARGSPRCCWHPESVDLSLLEQTLADRGEPAYRGSQVWEWLARGAASYEAMTNLPAALRAALAEAVPLSTLEVVTQREARDGTVKALFRT